jgi:hypothetical protein
MMRPTWIRWPVNREVAMQLAIRLVAALIAAAATTAAAEAEFDVFRYEVKADDAERFAELFRRTQGHPTAEQIARHYLQGAGPGVAIFTPGRIENARHGDPRQAQHDRCCLP